MRLKDTQLKAEILYMTHLKRLLKDSIVLKVSLSTSEESVSYRNEEFHIQQSASSAT